MVGECQHLRNAVAAGRYAIGPGGLAICTDTNTQYSAAVAALGTNWLVAWTDLRREHNGYGTDGDIFATLVAPLGTVATSNGFSICTANSAQTGVQLATLGDRCLVVWNDARNSSFNDHIAVYGSRISSSGQVLDPGGIVIDDYSQYQTLGQVAADGQNWMVVWSRKVDDYHCATVGRLVTSQGGGGATIFLENTLNASSEPALARGGTNYFAVWHSRRGVESWTLDVVGTRVTSTGTVLDTPAFPVALAPGTQVQPAAAGDGTNYLLVWSDNQRGDGRWDIYGARIAARGGVLDPGGFPITSLDTAETNPAVAFNGSVFLVAWVDTRYTDYRGYAAIYGARIGLDGSVLETNGFLIAQTSTSETTVDVASAGGNFLVVWGGRTDTYNDTVSCARVTGSGQLLDPSATVLFAGAGSAPAPKVASNRTNYSVIWQANYGGRSVVAANGGVLSSNYPASVGRRLTSNGKDFSTVWDSAYGINGSMFADSGAAITNFGLSTTFYNTDGYIEALAGNGRDYLLAYNPSRVNYPVFLTQVTKTGRIIQTNLVAFTNSSRPTQMTLASNGRDYLLAYWKLGSVAVPRLCARILDAAPRLSNPMKVSGQLDFTLDGAAELAYDILASSDLRSWASAGQVTNQNGSVAVVGPAVGAGGYYRARQAE